MIVCSCHGVPDSAIDSAIKGGARSVDQVAGACRAGSDCGSCKQMIRKMLERGLGHPQKDGAPLVSLSRSRRSD